MCGLCGRQCNKCVLHERCGGCSLCEAALCNKSCRQCYALCSNRPESVQYIKSIGGPGVEALRNEDIELPGHMPVLPDRFREIPKSDIMTVVGIHAGSMFSRNGEKINPSYLDRGFAGALNIDPKTEGVLQFYVRDRTLEGFWDNRRYIYHDLKKMNLKGIISPNFSVYEDAPRMDHIFNIKRTSVCYNEMKEAGLSSIPDISWYSRNDLDEWIREINRNKVKTIAFSFQVVDVQLKASNVWRTYILGFKYLCQSIDPGVRIVIIGLTSPRRIIEIFKAAEGHKISILNQSAFVQSRRGMLSQGRQENKDLTKDELFERNIIYFNELYNKMNEIYREEK